MMPTIRGNLETVKLLLEAGANPHLEVDNGQSPYSNSHGEIRTLMDKYASKSGPTESDESGVPET